MIDGFMEPIFELNYSALVSIHEKMRWISDTQLLAHECQQRQGRISAGGNLRQKKAPRVQSNGP